MGAKPRIVTEEIWTQEWQRVADSCSYATFFHTPLWYGAFSRMDSHARVATRTVRFADGKSAVLPLMVRRRYGGLVRAYETSPAGCYGGWISVDDLGPEHVHALASLITEGLGDVYWRVNPFDPAAAALAVPGAVADSTEALFLDRFPDEDALRAHYRHSVRKQINKGERFGLAVRPASDWGDWEAYFEIYRLSLQRWVTPSSYYPLDFFRGLFEAKSERIRLWLVTHGSQIVGGNLNFYQGTHCVEWHAVFVDEYFRHGSRNFLVHKLILDAHARGFRVYDFNPSGSNESTRAFKRSYGTESLAANVFERRRFKAVRSMLRRSRGPQTTR